MREPHRSRTRTTHIVGPNLPKQPAYRGPPLYPLVCDTRIGVLDRGRPGAVLLLEDEVLLKERQHVRRYPPVCTPIRFFAPRPVVLLGFVNDAVFIQLMSEGLI